jgi:PAS domain S-box-containing protein
VSAPELITAVSSTGDFSTIEAFIRTLSGQASIGIFLADPEGRTLYLNDRLRRIAGLALTPTPGECWLNAVAPEDHRLISTEWSQATSQDRSFSREFRFRRQDGTVRWVMAEAFPLRTGSGPSNGFVGTVRDVTPRQLALEALHASEERYRSLILLSPHAILVHSNGDILFVNQAGIRLFGWTKTGPVEGRPLSDFFQQEFLQSLPSPDTSVAWNPTAPVEGRLARPDGSYVEVDMVATPITFDGHTAIQILVTDITTQKETAAQLHAAKKMATVATLAGGIAHELNNCLTAIMGFSDLALPLLVPDNRAYGHVQQVILASKRARDLVTQMLVFGRQAENVKLPISLDILLKETLRIFRGKLPDSITLREWISGAIRPVLADPTQIHQICVSLLAHSRQVMKATGGVLEVRLDNVTLDTITTDHDLPLPRGPYVRLIISDTVEGMKSEVHTGMSDQFFTTAGTGDRTALDLAGVQRVVSEHGGTFRATSIAGQGTSIEIYLPAMLHPNSVVVADTHQEGLPDLTKPKDSLAEQDKER